MNASHRAAIRGWLTKHPEVLVYTAVFGVLLARYFVWVPRDYYPGGDGYYIYMFARSMAFDFDIELTNDYQLCGDPWAVGKDFGTGHPANPWYIGPAVLWAPVLFVLKHVVPLAADAPVTHVNACRGPIPFWLGLLGPVFVVWTVYLGQRIASRFVGRNVALTAVVIGAFGSLLSIFGPLWWNYSHVWAAATLTLACLYYVKITEHPERTGNWVGMGLALGFAALCRPHHMVWLLAPFAMTCIDGYAAIRRREVPYLQALRGLACLFAFGLVSWIRFASYDYMYGSPWPPMLRSVYLQPAHAHPFLVLFSARSGLMTYTPMMWLAVFGFFLWLRLPRRARTTWPLAAAFLIDFWICSSPLDWAAGATVGPRLLTSFCGMFVVWIALTLDVLRRWASKSRERLMRLAATGWLMPPLVLSWQLIHGDPPYDAPSIYGKGFRSLIEDIYKHIGNPMTFPAPVIFRARYRAPAADFDRVANYGIFFHDFERGRLIGPDKLVFRRPPGESVLLEGLEVTAAGRKLRTDQPGRFLVALAWPYVTSVRIDLASMPNRDGCRIRVANALFFRRDRSESVRVPRDATSVEIPVPAGMFDSGINETYIRSNCELELLSFQWIDTSSAANDTPMPHYENDPRFR